MALCSRPQALSTIVSPTEEPAGPVEATCVDHLVPLQLYRQSFIRCATLASTFDLSVFKKSGPVSDQYERQLHRLIKEGKAVNCIEKAARDALGNLSGTGRRSFLIYGEPQSGKTEMMICLTAKLLDDGRNFILHLLNDSVDLLAQNLGRFQASGLAPSAQNYTDVLDPAINLKVGRYVVFCKKNARDLQKLINKIGKLPRIIIIDDEADFASPNAKINQAEQTRINDLSLIYLGKREITLVLLRRPHASI
jgi:hypothetical protein